MLDAFFQGQADKLAHIKLQPPHFRAGLDSLANVVRKYLRAVGGGEMLVNAFDAAYVGNEDDIADDMSETSLAFWDGERQRMMAARPPRLERLRRKLVLSMRDEYPDLSRTERVARVDDLTDEQLIDAIKTAHHQATGTMMAGPTGDIGEWLSGIWSWLVENWPTVLKVLLSLLVFVI